MFGNGDEFFVKRTNGSIVKPHTHEFIELVYICSGEAYHEIDGVQYKTKKGDFLFINYGSNHAIYADSPFEYYNILFTPGFLSKELTNSRNAFDLLMLNSFSSFSKSNLHPMFTFTGSEMLTLERIIDELESEFNNHKNGYSEIIKSYMTIILITLFRKMEPASPFTEKKKIPAEMLEYIENHYKEKITINTLADRCFYNPSYFSRIFKEIYGVTLTQFIAEKRFENACRLLLTTDCTIEEIAITSGYKNTAAIYKHFKSKLGLTPKEYKQKNKKP